MASNFTQSASALTLLLRSKLSTGFLVMGNPRSQKEGIVVLTQADTLSFDRNSKLVIHITRNVMPYKIHANHLICKNVEVGEGLASIVLKFVSYVNNQKVYTHLCKTPQEPAEKLLPYGLMKDCLPTFLGGSLELVQPNNFNGILHVEPTSSLNTSSQFTMDEASSAPGPGDIPPPHLQQKKTYEFNAVETSMDGLLPQCFDGYVRRLNNTDPREIQNNSNGNTWNGDIKSHKDTTKTDTIKTNYYKNAYPVAPIDMAVAKTTSTLDCLRESNPEHETCHSIIAENPSSSQLVVDEVLLDPVLRASIAKKEVFLPVEAAKPISDQQPPNGLFGQRPSFVHPPVNQHIQSLVKMHGKAGKPVTTIQSNSSSRIVTLPVLSTNTSSSEFTSVDSSSAPTPQVTTSNIANLPAFSINTFSGQCAIVKSSSAPTSGDTIPPPAAKKRRQNTNTKGIKVPVKGKPTELDVLFGQGPAYVRHPGNRRFQSVIEGHSLEYDGAKKSAMKTRIRKAIIDAIGPGSRFLKKSHNQNVWYEVEDKIVDEKIAQSLRNHRKKRSSG